MQAAKAPTPGTTSALAPIATFGSETISTFLPVAANAFCADLIFPDP